MSNKIFERDSQFCIKVIFYTFYLNPSTTIKQNHKRNLVKHSLRASGEIKIKKIIIQNKVYLYCTRFV